MPYIRDRVFILKNEAFREQDARIIMFGREHGKMMAVARGYRRMQAKHLGHLEPLTEADVMIAVGQAFDKLAVARSVSTRVELRHDLSAITVLGVFASLVEQVTRPGLSEPDIYHLLCELASVWQGKQSSPERARLVSAAASLRLLDILGEAPNVLEMDDGNASDGSMTLLRFIRVRPLRDLLSVTAPSALFAETSAYIEACVERSPLVSSLHGPSTIHAFLA